MFGLFAETAPEIWGVDYRVFIVLCLLGVASFLDQLAAFRKGKRGTILTIILGSK